MGNGAGINGQVALVQRESAIDAVYKGGVMGAVSSHPLDIEKEARPKMPDEARNAPNRRSVDPVRVHELV